MRFGLLESLACTAGSKSDTFSHFSREKSVAHRRLSVCATWVGFPTKRFSQSRVTLCHSGNALRREVRDEYRVAQADDAATLTKVPFVSQLHSDRYFCNDCHCVGKRLLGRAARFRATLARLLQFVPRFLAPRPVPGVIHSEAVLVLRTIQSYEEIATCSRTPCLGS